MRTLVAVAIFALLCGCSSSNSGNTQATSEPTTMQSQAAAAPMKATLHNSTTTFKAAQTACAGALGSVTFSLSHARGHAASGAQLQEQPAGTPGVVTMVFTDKANGNTATVEVNSHDRSVSGKNLTVKLNKSVACVEPE